MLKVVTPAGVWQDGRDPNVIQVSNLSVSLKRNSLYIRR